MLPDQDSDQGSSTAASAAQAGQNLAKLAKASNPAGLAASVLTDKKSRKKLIILLLALILIPLLLGGMIIMMIAALFGGKGNNDTASSTVRQFINLRKSVVVCDSDGQNCEAKSTGVKGEKLLIYSITLTPTASNLKFVTLRDLFGQGKEKLQPNFLRMGIGSNPSFFDIEANIKNEAEIAQVSNGCRGDYSLDNICFGVAELTGPATFVVTVKTKPDFTEEEVIINEALVNGFREGFGGQVDAQDIFKRARLSGVIRSQRLIDLFNEVGSLSGVPACALAGIAALESPDFFFNALDDHDAFTQGLTTVSPANAVGLMQVSIPTGIGTSQSALDKGAAMAGRPLTEILAKPNYFDLRTNIFLGAGYLQEKIGRGDWTDDRQVYNTGCRYHGVCPFPGGDYGSDFLNNLRKCELNNPSAESKVRPNEKEDRTITPRQFETPVPGREELGP